MPHPPQARGLQGTGAIGGLGAKLPLGKARLTLILERMCKLCIKINIKEYLLVFCSKLEFKMMFVTYYKLVFFYGLNSKGFCSPC